MSTGSIKPAKLSDAIAEHIQQLILEGALRPGERLLSERELSVKLDVSRPSLREAIDKLVEAGLLATNEKGVAFVSQKVGISLRDPLALLMESCQARIDCLELRSAVESSATAFAAERASKVDRAEITKHFNAMVAAHKAYDIDKIAEADAEFHLAIYESSHNVMMLHFMRSLEDVLRSNVYFNRKTLYEQRACNSQLAEHEAIFDAIMARDPERAREASRYHMTTAMQAQREIHEAERRMEASIRRLARVDLVATDRKREPSG